MEEIYAVNNSVFKTKEVTLDEILANIGNYPLTTISFNSVMEINNTKKVIFAHDKMPIVYADNFFMDQRIDFDRDYYLNNKQELQPKLCEILRKNNSDTFTFQQELYDIELLKAVVENPNITCLLFDGHVLTVEEYEIIKNSNINSVYSNGVAPELRDIHGGILKSNDSEKIIGDYSYNQLQDYDTIIISSPLNDYEIENLKYLKDDAKIKLSNISDFSNVRKILDKCREFNKKLDIILVVQSNEDFNYKNEFNEYIKNNPDFLEQYKDLNIGIGISEEYSLDYYYSHEKRLLDMIEPAKDLSPLEKYIFAYNIVKKLKKYKEADDSSLSRKLYNVMDSEYMVCVGYATLLCDLLTKLGIENKDYSADVDIGLDKVSDDALVLPDDVLTHAAGHARVEYKIVDPKYNVEGYFLADPTWDNVMDSDTYNYSVLSHNEYNGIHRYNFLDFNNSMNCEELFFVNSIDEFYDKVNIWLNKNISKSEKDTKESVNKALENYKIKFKEFMDVLKEVHPNTYEHFNYAYGNLYNMSIVASNTKRFQTRMEKIVKDLQDSRLSAKFKELDDTYSSLVYTTNINVDRYRDLMSLLVKSFKGLDNDVYQIVKKMFDDISEKASKKNNNESVYEANFSEFISFVGEIIVNRVNKQVDGETLLAAIREVQLKAYGVSEENIDEVMDNIIEINKERQKRAFPIRYIVNDDGTRVPIMNENNKFDIESDIIQMSR